MTLPRYPKYRPSNIKWLRELPVHWDVRRLGQIGELSKGTGGSKNDEVSSGVPCIRYGDLYTTHQHFISRSRSFVSESKAEQYLPIEFGDVLFAASGETIDEIGKSAVNLMQVNACCGGDIILFRPDRQVEARFMGYVLDCSLICAQKSMMGRGITVMHIYSNQLKDLTLPLPPLPEQFAIASFLDDTTARINLLITKYRTLIERLEETHSTLISRVVTLGIPPERGAQSDSVSELKVRSSGVDWLGNIKKDWQVRRLKTVCSRSALYGANIAAAHYTDDGIRFLRTTDITDSGQIREGGVFVPELLAREYLLSDGDLIISRSGTIGRSLLYDSKIHGPCAYAGYLVRFVPESETLARFVYWFTRSKSFDMFLALMSISSTIENLNGEKYANLLLPIPCFVERLEIVDFLDNNTALIESIVSKIETSIARLKEYRSALVTAAVTGAIDVREISPRIASERSTNLDAKNVASVTMPRVFQDFETPGPSASTVFPQGHGGET